MEAPVLNLEEAEKGEIESEHEGVKKSPPLRRLVSNAGRGIMIEIIFILVTTESLITADINLVHRCGADGSMSVCHAEDTGSIPRWGKFPG